MMTENSATKIEARIVEKPAFTVVGMLARHDPGHPHDAVVDGFRRPAGAVRGRTEPGVFYGAMHNFDMQTNEFDYVAGVQVQAGQTAPEGMVSWEIPAQTYAVFETTLPQIGVVFETIYQSWLPASDVERADGPEFELRRRGLQSAGPGVEDEHLDSRAGEVGWQRPAWERATSRGWRSQAGGV